MRGQTVGRSGLAEACALLAPVRRRVEEAVVSVPGGCAAGEAALLVPERL